MLNRNSQTLPWADGAAAFIKAEWEWVRRDWEARRALGFIWTPDAIPSPPVPPVDKRKHEDTSVSLHPLTFDEAMEKLAQPRRKDS